MNDNNIIVGDISSEIKIISAEKLSMTGAGTIRIMVEIKGNLFKRLYTPNYPVVWHDEYCTFNDCLAMTPEQESDLEGIFKAYMLTKGLTEDRLLTEKIQE